MTSKCEVTFTDLTHVIIDTGYAPPLGNLLEIESVLRDEFESNITCLFANDTTWHLGVMIPCPFGFKPHTLHLPPQKSTKPEIYIEQTKSQIDQMMSLCKQHPFYDYAMQSLSEQLHQFEEIYQNQKEHQRLDLYETLHDAVYEWSLQPESPDHVFDYRAYKELEEEHLNGSDDKLVRIYDAFWGHELIMKETYKPVPSYDDRRYETQTIMDLFGGPEHVNGCLCFKLATGDHADVMKILDTIIKNDLSYCASFGLDGFQYVTNGHMKILVLKYDAEHG